MTLFIHKHVEHKHLSARSNSFLSISSAIKGICCSRLRTLAIASATIAASLTSMSVLAQDTNSQIQAISEELVIMDSVLSTAFKQASDDQSIKFTRMHSRYLANQGVVFTVSSTQSTWGMTITKSSFFPSSIAPPPPPPLPAVGGNYAFADIDDIEPELAERLEAVRGRLSDTADRLREYTGAARDGAWQMRDLEREKRDLAFEQRAASAERKKAIEARQAAIEQEIAEVKRQQELQAKEIKEVREARKAELEKQRQASKEASQSFIQAFEKTVSSNLCRFGAGLRALPSDQNVSFILENINSGIDNKAQSRIYVFSAADMKKCVQEKITESQFLNKATVYNF